MAELASKAGTTLAVLSRRLVRLRLNGQIVAKEAIINWQILGYKVEVSLRVTLDKTHQLAFDNFINEARKIQELVLEIDPVVVNRRHFVLQLLR